MCILCYFAQETASACFGLISFGNCEVSYTATVSVGLGNGGGSSSMSMADYAPFYVYGTMLLKG